MIDLIKELCCCCDYFETCFMLLDLSWLFSLFWDLFYVVGFVLVVGFILELILCFSIYLGCWVYLFWDLFYPFEFNLVVGFILWFVLCCYLPYFAINYNVEFDNLLIILFFPNLFATYSFIFFFYYKSNIVFFFNN